ncbi:hypothetical protein EKD04_021975 [Chloroflexales bacterium ZM16-3]|nr:hypothetical protein [Chloroflexales bacterium ZM16-3]
MQYTVPLALQDYMTVVFSGIGMVLLTRMVAQMDRNLGRMAMIGMVLTIAGGALKATGKLVLALGGPDIAVMNLGLFPLIAPGFTLLAWSLYQVRRIFRNQPVQGRPWLVPSVVIGLFAAGCLALGFVGGPWRVPLILLSSIANIAMLLMLALAAWGRKMWLSGALFLITLVVVVAMSQMAQIPNQTIAMVWGEQLSQTVAQALFAFAAWHYGQVAVATYRSMVPQMA